MVNFHYMKESSAMSVHKPLVKVLKIFLKTILCFFILSIGLTLFYRFVPVAYTPLMFWRTIGSVFTEKKNDWNGKKMGPY